MRRIFQCRAAVPMHCCKTRGKSAVSVALEQELYAGPKRLFGGVRYLGVFVLITSWDTGVPPVPVPSYYQLNWQKKISDVRSGRV